VCPFSLILSTDHGWQLHLSGHDGAIQQLQNTVTMNPNFSRAHISWSQPRNTTANSERPSVHALREGAMAPCAPEKPLTQMRKTANPARHRT